LAALKQFSPTGDDLNEVEDGKRFPVAAPDEFTDLHVLLHSPSRPVNLPADVAFEGPQQPYFASSDVQEAYEAAITKIDINQPINSRLYVRLNSERHNCWTNDCGNDCSLRRHGAYI